MKTKPRAIALFILLSAFVVAAQNTDFTYQGQLQSSSAAANGNFDFEFLLFDSGGSQIGPMLTRNGVSVTNGIFSVNLDFGSSFPGASRFLEIRVRPAGGGAFTTLSPRQPVNSAPYSIKSLTANNADNATNAVNATNAITATNFTGNLVGDVTGTQSATTVARLQNRNIAATAPSNGQVLKYNAATSQWTPDTDNTGSGGGGTITGVTAGTGLTGGGANGNVMLGIAPGGVGPNEIANNAVIETKIVNGAVTAPKIPAGQVVKNLNGLTDNVTLAAGSNITITPAGNTLTIASTGGGGGGGILNQTTQQANADFNISGTGTAGILNATTQYDIGGSRFMRGVQILGNTYVGFNVKVTGPQGSNNSYFGSAAGRDSTTGSENSVFGAFSGFANAGGSNSFFGFNTGSANTSGSENAFFGAGAGRDNTSASGNAFFGTSAGRGNTTSSNNSFFGTAAGIANNASNNSFFGFNAGNANVTGFNNSFFGIQSGRLSNENDNTFFGAFSGFNTTGFGNTFVGSNAGRQNGIGVRNTVIGFSADVETASLVNATAIGANARVSQNDSLVLGNNDVRVGIGTSAPSEKLHIVVAPGFAGQILMGDAGCGLPFTGIGFAPTLAGCSNYSLLGQGIDTFINRPPGGAIFFRENNSDQMTIASGGNVNIGTNLDVGARLNIGGNVFIENGAIRLLTIPSGGQLSLCLGNDLIARCSSSIRYKSNISSFDQGLSLINKLRPVSFNWKSGGMADMGLVAEEVNAVEPLLTTTNDKGEVEGVKYDRIGVVLVNAVKEQQAQIEAQQIQLADQSKTIKRQQAEIDALKIHICSQSPTAAFCKP